MQFKEFLKVPLRDFLIIFYTILVLQNVFSNSTAYIYQNLVAKNDATLLKNKSQINYGTKRAEIAFSEYTKGVRETEKGCNCGQRIDLYTAGLKKQWCAMFASWVFEQAGNPLKGTSETTPWRITNARQIAKYLEKEGEWFSKDKVIKNNLNPQIGDVVVFWRGNFEGSLGHVDIVVATSSEFGVASLVGGNLNDQVTFRENYRFSEHFGFLGFGRPKNENQIKHVPTTGTKSLYIPKTNIDVIEITTSNIQ